MLTSVRNIGRLLGCHNDCSIEFLLDDREQFWFTEVNTCIQVEHPIAALVSLVDLVRKQLRIAANLLCR